MEAMQQASREGGGEVKAISQDTMIALLFAVLLTAFLMVTAQVCEFKDEAVKRGFATWVSDENGNTTFTWKEPTP